MICFSFSFVTHYVKRTNTYNQLWQLQEFCAKHAGCLIKQMNDFIYYVEHIYVVRLVRTLCVVCHQSAKYIFMTYHVFVKVNKHFKNNAFIVLVFMILVNGNDFFRIYIKKY